MIYCNVLLPFAICCQDIRASSPPLPRSSATEGRKFHFYLFLCLLFSLQKFEERKSLISVFRFWVYFQVLVCRGWIESGLKRCSARSSSYTITLFHLPTDPAPLLTDRISSRWNWECPTVVSFARDRGIHRNSKFYPKISTENGGKK